MLLFLFPVLKDEPEDLTHLAPTAGDTCIPLEDTPDLLMGDLLDEFILPDNYCPLLSDACDNSKHMADMSPSHSFYTYRDDRSLSPDALTHVSKLRCVFFLFSTEAKVD